MVKIDLEHNRCIYYIDMVDPPPPPTSPLLFRVKKKKVGGRGIHTVYVDLGVKPCIFTVHVSWIEKERKVELPCNLTSLG